MLKKVLDHRQGILLASAGALLHNLGKVSSQFVEMQCDQLNGKYFYQHIPGLFLADCSAKDLAVNRFLERYSFHGKIDRERKQLAQHLGQDHDVTAQVLQDKTKMLLKGTTISSLPTPFGDRPYRIGDLIEYLSQGEPFYSKPQNHSDYLIQEVFSSSSLLTHLMNKCHGGASGGEKDAIYRLQQKLLLYLATPLGFEQLAPDLTEYDKIKGEVEKVVQKHLSDPDKFSLRKFMAELEPLLRRIPADTQRGVNDVTVWDIGHSGMAFLKAGIWSCAEQDELKRQTPGQKLEHGDFDEGGPRNYQPKDHHPRWRLWRVGLNGLDFLTGAVSVADLRVRQRLLQEYLETARQFAEDEYPVATEIYRDENGGIYVFPDWEEGKSPEYEAFARELEKALPGKAGTDLSLPELYGLRPAIELSGERYHNHPECRGSSVKYIGDAVREWVEKPLAAAPVFEAYTDSFDTDLCPYCGVRPIGGGENLLQKLPEKELPEKERRCTAVKARQRKICCLCMCARGWVAKEWWEKENFSTIWVDEVADANGRVALVVGKFGVEKMLGDMVYPPDKAMWQNKYTYWARVRCVKGGLSSPGARFTCDNIEFEVIQSVPPEEQEVVASSRVRTFRKVVKLVAIDFSPCFATTGRQVLLDPLELEFKNVRPEHSSGVYELECKDDTKILEQCKNLTGRNDLKWKQLKDVVFEFEIENRVVKGQVVGGRKVKVDQNLVENLLLWTNGSGSYFYVEECKEVRLCSFLKEWNNWVGKGARLFPASSASFARFRRVWETTARFWREVAPLKDPLKDQVEDWQKELAGCLAVEALGDEGKRRRLEVHLKDLKNPGSIAPFHAYELEVAGVSIGIVPTEVQGDRATCVTIENLGYIARQLGAPKKTCTDPCAAAVWVSKRLLAKGDGEKERSVRIKAAQGYGHGKDDCGTANINDVQLAGKDYRPVIPVLANPRVFAVLLPASAAVELVRRIHEKYTEEMGKVRWRLPLTLGTVFFPRRLPLRVVLDAGWRLLDQTKQIPRITAKVTSVERLGTATHNNLGKHPEFGQWPAKVTVTAAVTDPAPAQHDRQARLRWKVPTVMGDKCTFDIWYPWVKLADPNAPADRPLSFRHNDTTWLHVTELKPGDEIAFCPSTWDFVFLENAGERFTIAYGKDGRRLGLKRRPYYLEELEPLTGFWRKIKDKGKQKLTSTQLHALWQALLERYARWTVDKNGAAQPATANDKAWQRFCRDTLLNAGWKEKDAKLPDLLGKASTEPPSLDCLTGLAASGALFDLFELYMTILKEGE